MLRATLAELGYTVTEARNGKESLALHKSNPADLVITDLIMPEKEGIETISELLSLQPELKIIAMSGDGRVSAKDYLPIAKWLGAARVLTKPFANEHWLRRSPNCWPGPEHPGRSDSRGQMCRRRQPGKLRLRTGPGVSI